MVCCCSGQPAQHSSTHHVTFFFFKKEIKKKKKKKKEKKREATFCCLVELILTFHLFCTAHHVAYNNRLEINETCRLVAGSCRSFPVLMIAQETRPDRTNQPSLISLCNSPTGTKTKRRDKNKSEIFARPLVKRFVFFSQRSPLPLAASMP